MEMEAHPPAPYHNLAVIDTAVCVVAAVVAAASGTVVSTSKGQPAEEQRLHPFVSSLLHAAIYRGHSHTYLTILLP